MTRVAIRASVSFDAIVDAACEAVQKCSNGEASIGKAERFESAAKTLRWKFEECMKARKESGER